MVLFSGKLSRTDYWKKLIGSFLITIISFGLLLVLLDLLDAELPGASATNQALAVALLTLSLASILTFAVYWFSLTVCRARDAGHVVLWTVMAVLLPPGWVLIGLIPSRK